MCGSQHRSVSCTLKISLTGGERWLEDGRASVNMFRVARSPMQKAAIRGDPLPRQVHYYSNVGDRLPVLGDEERETRQTFQELVQLGHTCVVLLRRAIWSVDPTVFQPQYNLQVCVHVSAEFMPRRCACMI